MKINKIMEFLRKYYFVYLPIIISLFTVLFLEPWYDFARDDLTLANMVHSAEYNPNSEYLVFISFILGYIMRFAALAFPTLNIYAITLVISMTLAFSVFFYNTKKYNNKGISIFVVALLQIYMICGITFTVVALVCCAAAVMVVIDNVNKLNRKSIIFFVVSFILFFIGFSFRRGSVATAICMLFVPMCFFAVRNKKATLSVILTLVLVFTGTYQFLKITQNIYSKNLFAGTDYLEYSKYRGIATDGGDLYYDEHKELFEANGISKNDFQLCRDFFYNDKVILPTENIKIISECFSFKDKYTLSPVEIIKDMKNAGICLVSFIGIISVINFILNKKNRKEIFVCCLFVVGAILYLYIRKRGMVRVVKPVAFIGHMQMLNIFLRGKIDVLTNHVVVRRILAAVVVITVVFVGANTIPNKGNMGKDLRECLEYIKNDDEYIYVSINSVRRDNIVSFKRPEPLSDNIVSGVYVGWMGYSPYWYSNLKKHGLEKYKDGVYLSLTDEKVKIACGYETKLKRLVKGLEEHYGREFEIKKEKNFGGYFICTLEEKTY